MGAVSFGSRGLWVNRGRIPDEYDEWPARMKIADLNALPLLTL
jgi:hypothetical protein